MTTRFSFFFVLLFLLFVSNIFSQTATVDSIRKLIYSSTSDRQKLSAILDYCDEYQSLNKDTAYNFALLALDMSKKTNDVRNLARAQLAFANSYYLWGWVDSASAVCDDALKKYNAASDATRDVYFRLLRQKALCYGGIQKFPEALEILYKLLGEAKQFNDSITIASTCNTLGSLNINMEKLAEARTWISRALEYDTKDKRFIVVKAALLTNSARVYMDDKKPDTALQYISLALPLCRASQNLNTLATALRIRSNLYVDMKRYDAAETDLREMLHIRQMLSGNGSNIVDDNIQIANFYAGSGQLEKAIAICRQNIKEGDVYNTRDSMAYTNHLSMKLEYYKVLAGFYKQAGIQKDYTAILEEINSAKDSFYISNSAQAIAEVQTKYETEQKEKTILRQRYDLAKKNFLIYGSLILLALASIIFYLLFRDYRRKQKIRMQSALAQQQEARQVAVRQAEENERSRIAADLHDNLGVHANAILYNTELLMDENKSDSRLTEDLHDTAKLMLLTLRETLWAMKTNEIDAKELWLRIISFSKQMGRHYAKIKFKIEGTVPQQLQLPAAKALNIVMIVQEAIQNAIKHSSADEIILSSIINDDNWQITIADNGEGFDLANAHKKSESYGLKNMQQRAMAGNIHFEIGSREKGGSWVRLIIGGEAVTSPPAPSPKERGLEFF